MVVAPLVSWYIQSNLLEGSCPECGGVAQVLKGQQGRCMYCGSTFSSELQGGVFMRDGPAATEDGVIEVIVDDDY